MHCYIFNIDDSEQTLIHSYLSISFLRYPNLTQFYTESEPWTDYVCSLPSDKGMRQCSEIKPLYSFDGLICNGTALPDADNNYVANSSECVNWNQYYTKCAISDENPFLSSISFDNILYAWIAIFQVRQFLETSFV